MSAPTDTTAAATTTTAPETTPAVAETPAATTTAPADTKETPATAPTTTTGTAAGTTGQTGKQQPLENKDIEHWIGRLNEVAKTSGKSEAAVPEAKAWHESLFACFDPIDTCLITCCFPCLTFGKVHHRLHHNGQLEGFSYINTSCILFCLSGCLACIPACLQRGDVRKKYKLEGDLATDSAITFCCGCCSIIQSDKEAAHQEKLLLESGTQYTSGNASMEYKAPVA